MNRGGFAIETGVCAGISGRYEYIKVHYYKNLEAFEVHQEAVRNSQCFNNVYCILFNPLKHIKSHGLHWNLAHEFMFSHKATDKAAYLREILDTLSMMRGVSANEIYGRDIDGKQPLKNINDI